MISFGPRDQGQQHRRAQEVELADSRRAGHAKKNEMGVSSVLQRERQPQKKHRTTVDTRLHYPLTTFTTGGGGQPCQPGQVAISLESLVRGLLLAMVTVVG